VFLRQELVSRITELAEKFSPDNEWFIKTLNTVFLVAGDLV
jgi:AP-4 complex subunit epsilon-1